MTKKISVYVTKEMHSDFKTAAGLLGKSLSEFMVDAAKLALHSPDRKAVSAKMDQIRASVKAPIPTDDIRKMREEGRRF